MAQRKKWTHEEDVVLAIVVQSNQENKNAAFKEASEILKRSMNSCSSRWYTALSNPEHKAYVGANFFGIKETTPVQYCIEKKKPSLWQRIKKIFGKK